METLLATILSLLLLAVFIFLIIGLISPKKVLFWVKKPTRGKVFLYWILLNVILVVLTVMGSLYLDSKKSPEERYQIALNDFNNKNYSGAVYGLEKIPNDSPIYDKAMALKSKADSLHQIELDEQIKQEAKEKGVDTTMLEIVSVRLAKESVKQILKAPSTAEFPGENQRIWYLPDSTVIVKGAVDSQNSFGAMLRSNFYFKAKWYGDFEDLNNWEIIAVQLE